jgi:2'-5' RNA ligase
VHALTRAFVAVPCGEPLAGELSRRLDASADDAPVRWTDPLTWHLTLQFLGNWPTARLRALQHGLEALAALSATELRPAGLGGFPDLWRPRVLFLQFRDAEPLVELAAGVRLVTGAMWPEGPQDTRPLQPHLTLARVRQPLDRRHVNALSRINLDDLPLLAMDRFCLMASQVVAGVTRHTELASFALRKKGE